MNDDATPSRTPPDPPSDSPSDAPPETPADTVPEAVPDTVPDTVPEAVPDTVPEPGGAPDDAEWRRRRRLATVFGDVLPETTSDDRDGDVTPADAQEARDAQDRWLRSQVPPHHG